LGTLALGHVISSARARFGLAVGSLGACHLVNGLIQFYEGRREPEKKESMPLSHLVFICRTPQVASGARVPAHRMSEFRVVTTSTIASTYHDYGIRPLLLDLHSLLYPGQDSGTISNSSSCLSFVMPHGSRCHLGPTGARVPQTCRSISCHLTSEGIFRRMSAGKNQTTT